MLAVHYQQQIQQQEQAFRKRRAEEEREQHRAREAEKRLVHNRTLYYQLVALKERTLRDIQSLIDLKTWSMKDTLRTRINKIKEDMRYETPTDLYHPVFDHTMLTHDQALDEQFTVVSRMLEAQIDQAGEKNEVIDRAFDMIEQHYQALCNADHPRMIIAEAEPSVIQFKQVLSDQMTLYKNRFEGMKKQLQEGYELWSKGCKKYLQEAQGFQLEIKTLGDQFLSSIEDLYPTLDCLEKTMPANLLIHLKGCRAAIRLLFFIQADQRPDCEILQKGRVAAEQQLKAAEEQWKKAGRFFRFSKQGRAITKELKESERLVKLYHLVDEPDLKDVTALNLVYQGLMAERSSCSWYHLMKKHRLNRQKNWVAGLISVLDKHSTVHDLLQRLEEPTWAQAKYLFSTLFEELVKVLLPYKGNEPFNSFFKAESVINTRYENLELSEILKKISKARTEFFSSIKAAQIYPLSSHSAVGRFSLWKHGDIARATPVTQGSLSNWSPEFL
jgi:hypothetical protein